MHKTIQFCYDTFLDYLSWLDVRTAWRPNHIQYNFFCETQNYVLGRMVIYLYFFFSILSQREFWFLATVAFGLLSWGDLISNDYRQFDFTDTI